MGCLLLKSTEGQGRQRTGLFPASEASSPKHQLLGEDLRLFGSLVNLAPQVQNHQPADLGERQNCQIITSSTERAGQIPTVQPPSRFLW